MRPSLRTTLVALVLAVAVSAAPAAAQQTPLQQAEAAYLDIDFEATHRHAMAALRAGGSSPEQLVRIYQLLGIASSALGRETEARDFFVRMLALDRDAQLDASVPPRLRDPFLEARGVWAARPGRFDLQVGLDRGRSAVRVEVTDPSGMARRIAVHARLEGEAQYVTQEAEGRTTVEVVVPGANTANRVEYYVDVLDEHGNRMRSEGTAFAPRSVGRDPVAGGGGAPAGGGTSIFEEPAFWIVTAIIVAAGAGTAAGVIVDQRSRIGVQSTVSIGIDL
jgi:hypothetical protein